MILLDSLHCYPPTPPPAMNFVTLPAILQGPFLGHDGRFLTRLVPYFEPALKRWILTEISGNGHVVGIS